MIPPLDPLAMSPFLQDYARPSTPIGEAIPFAYNQDADVVFGTETVLTIETESDSDFIMTGMSMLRSSAAHALNDQFDLVTIQITDLGTGKTLFNEATEAQMLCGMGGFPFILPIPRVFQPNIKITASLNKLNAGTVHCWLSLQGTRLYYANAGGATSAGTPR